MSIPPAIAQDTYRYLRVMLVTLPVLLLVGSALAFFWLGAIETSISAYYLGPIRDLFVGVMLATAACMVVYKGTSVLEDYSLNVAGFCGVFVALVPTALGTTLEGLDPELRAEVVAALRVSAVAVLLVSALYVAADVRTGLTSPRALSRNPLTRVLLWVTTASLLGFVGLVVWRVVEGTRFAGVHLVAAVLLVASLAMAVSSHAWPESTDSERTAEDPRGRDHRSAYRVIFWLMAAGAPLFALMLLVGWDYAVIAIEWYEIGLFIAFWVMETRRTWAFR